jgi:pimeloyl-ACP methyl ester carboxylesterase
MIRIFPVLILMVMAGCSAGLIDRMPRHWSDTPAAFGLDYQDVIIVGEDGVRLHGWWLQAKRRQRGALYFLHDLEGNVGDYLHRVKDYPAAGLSVFLIDYRGFGLSEGRVQRSHIAGDVLSGLRWLRSSGKAGGDAIVVLAHGAVATEIGRELEREDHKGRFDCLISLGRGDDYEAAIKSIEETCFALTGQDTMPDGRNVAPDAEQTKPLYAPAVPRFTF